MMRIKLEGLESWGLLGRGFYRKEETGGKQELQRANCNWIAS